MIALQGMILLVITVVLLGIKIFALVTALGFTPQHYEALDRYGPSPIHRRSFEPVRLAWQAKFGAPLSVAHG